ncbi:DUF4129 domain-containing protein [Balneola sp. MJW-20]|uniref:DUF4129 domain-containing protein n=1 Tax=Gracilimonas aurantiaca TaxID=3234185 RepID=UPI0034663F1B
MIQRIAGYLLSAFILLFFWQGGVAAQSTESDSLPTDTSQVRNLELNSSLHDDLTGKGIYDYRLEPENPESFWQRFRRWFLTTIYEFLQTPWINTILKVFFYLIFGVILIALIIQLLGGDIQGAFTSNNAHKKMNLNIGIEDIRNTDLQKEYDKAVKERDFALAVRFLYLMSIQELDERGLLTWKKDKTNHEYLQELSGSENYQSFSRLTYYYDYIEYGEFPVNEESFSRVRSLYEQISNGSKRP